MKASETNKQEQHYKKISRYLLIGIALVSIFLGYKASQLEFNYDFEKFFPNQDNQLAFFQNYRETFENDNDFILIGLVNEEGIFRKDFLNRTQAFTEKLRKLPHIREVVTPLEMTYFKASSMGLGMMESPYFHVDDPKQYQKDAANLSATKMPIREMVALNENAIIIVVKNIQLISKKKSDELAIALNELTRQHEFDELHLMGKIIGQKEYIEIMAKEFIIFSSIAVSVLVIFLIIAYRSLWGIIIPMVTVVLSAAGSLGFMQLSGTYLNMMTMLMPIIMLVVGMSDVVHLVSKYLEEIRYKRSKVQALKNMLKKVGVATLLTSLTTALGFVTLVGVEMAPVREFGIYTAIGVLLAFVISILFIPSIFMLIKKPVIINAKRVQNNWERGLSKVFVSLCRRRKTVIGIYIMLTLLAVYGTSRIEFDYFLMQDLGKEDPLMKELDFFQSKFGGVRPFEMAILPQEGHQLMDFKVMREIEKIETYLDTAYGVNQMLAPTLPFKTMNQTFRNGNQAYFKIPEREKRFDFLKKQMGSLTEHKDWSQLMSEDQNMGRIFGRMVDPGSKEVLLKNQKLEQFVDTHIDNRVLKYKLTGTPVIIDESSRYVAKNVIYGLLVAFGIIALFMGILFRSVKMALLSIVPNVFPILLTAGYIGFVGIDLNMTTAIVFTIAFGIAVDDTIHFLSRYRQEIKSGRSRLFGLRRTFISTGKAIIITTLILLGGFSSLLFSGFLSTYYIGLFVCMTLIFALITDMTLLPMLLLGRKKDRLTHSV